MNLSSLLDRLRGQSAYQAARTWLAGRSQTSFSLRLQRSARVPVAAALATDDCGTTLLVAARADRASSVAEELTAWAPAARILTFVEPNPLFYETSAWGPRTVQSRLGVLAELAVQSQASA